MKWLLHNFWIKLLAALMAFLLWLHVATERAYEIECTYRLEFVGLAGDLILASPPPATLTARCRGTGKRVFLLLVRERVWPVDLSAFTRGTAELQLTVQDAPAADAQDVQFLSIPRNAQMRLEIDRRREKTVPIITAFDYVPREGFVRVGREVLSPDSLVLSGPAGALKTITAVKTRSRLFAGLTGPVDEPVDFEPFTAYNVSMNISRCRLVADVQPYAERTLDSVVVTPPRAQGGGWLAIEPSAVAVTIGGGRQAVNALDASRVQAETEAANPDNLPVRRPVAVHLPLGFGVVRVEPDSVLVRLP